jgi:D-serine deaminase-like pyridoxal phosphate-dependent protein
MVAIDSPATARAAADNGVRAVLIDVNVGMPRCGCAPEQAGSLAASARAADLEVRGVMGYEGHAVLLDDRDARRERTTKAMSLLARAHADVGGHIVSAGGTGTFDINTVATEIQAGSYALMDTAYAQLDVPFERAVAVAATIVHVAEKYSVADCGLKALGMDHGNPAIDDAQVWFCSDEHITFAPTQPVEVGDVVLVWPAHVDPTVAYHDRMHIAETAHVDASIIDTWDVDLRGWDVSA